MIPESLSAPLRQFAIEASRIRHLIAVIAFGSVVRGDMSKKSDIDVLLLFDTSHDPETGTEARQTQTIASRISTQYDLTYPFSFVFMSTQKAGLVDPDFIWTVASEGVVLWAKPEMLLTKPLSAGLKPVLLITYSLSSLKGPSKRKLLRWLYTSKKHLLDKDQIQLKPGVLLLSSEKFDEVKPVFDQFHVRYTVRKMWSS